VAFVANMLDRTESVDIELDADDVSTIREWFGDQPHPA
jgi:hypothetical protein